MTGEPSITCPKCKRTSYNLLDIINSYCGYCHDWLSSTTVPPEVKAEAQRRWREILPEERMTQSVSWGAGDGD